MSGRGTSAVESGFATPPTSVPIEDVFVSIDLGSELAHVAYETETGISWEEMTRADGEFLSRIGATTQVVLARRVHVAGRSA